MSDNQCMGCQAGWPIRGGNHKVVGGYPGELVACTKERYTLDEIRRKAVRALSVFGSHKIGCDLLHTEMMDATRAAAARCTCGYSDAVKELQP